MRMTYALDTWLLANLLHPPLLVIIYADETFSINMELVGTLLASYVFLFVISLPSLVIGICLIELLSKINLPVIRKFVALVILAPMIALLNVTIILLVIGEGNLDEWEDIRAVAPCAVAAVLALLFRYKQFVKIGVNPGEQPEFENIDKD